MPCARLLAVAVLAVTLGAVLMCLPIQSAFAQVLTLDVSPNPVVQGQVITFSGTEDPPVNNQVIALYIFWGGDCAGTPLRTETPVEDASGYYVYTLAVDPAYFPVGQYCAYSKDPYLLVVSPAVPFAVIAHVTISAPVGGFMEPVNKLVVLAPWLAVISLVGCIGTVVVVTKKCR